MALSDDFNNSHSPRKISDSVLRVSFEYHQYYYDFQLRVMTTVITYGGNGAVHSIPFSQLDRETLVDMREKLIELKGKPPELPVEAPVNPGNNRSLRP